MDKKKLAIGIFDSGVGGLTVVKEIIKSLPNESIIYLGDTARVPYGPRGQEVITEFALELADYLIKKDVKYLVVACNTISATCLEEIKKHSPVPVLGVIDPTIEEAIKNTKSKKVGVIGTRATISSGMYQNNIQNVDPSIEVISQACPLFVPLAEENEVNSEATKLIATKYLEIFKNSGIDTLILGCTHYPLLKSVIQEIVGSDVTLIDSAKPTAEVLKELLEKDNLLNSGEYSKVFYVTDAPERTNIVGGHFLESEIKVEKVIL
jgi:glutamate racemase